MGLLKTPCSRWFEYHCWESPDSNDATLWYHSHQRVSVVELLSVEDFARDWTKTQRSRAGCPATYTIQFEDGHTGAAFEDELLAWRSQFERPDPPQEDDPE